MTLMNISAGRKATQQINPIDLLKQAANSLLEGYLKVVYSTTTYQIYFHHGRIVYACYSVSPFESLERQLRRLNYYNPNLTGAVRTQVRLSFANRDQVADYQAINWLIEQKFISLVEAGTLVETITREVLQSYLSLDNFEYEFIKEKWQQPLFIILPAKEFVLKCERELRAWQSLAPYITSPYQRAYLQDKQNPEIGAFLSKMLIGFNFRQLGVILNEEDLQVARNVYSWIVKGVIVLKEPQYPFDKLPKIRDAQEMRERGNSTVNSAPAPMATPKQWVEQIDKQNINRKTPKVACVDDSQTILNEINRFLEGNNLEIHTINDSVKALMEIVRLKPDLVLLDVGMPTLDGYKLCRLIRNHSMFKNTPIVMVTGNTSEEDKAKARLAGATDYMTKPFTQPELLKMVFRYLS